MQAITTKYLAPTNTQGARIKAKCAAGQLVVEFDYALNEDERHQKAAEALRDKLGWNKDFYGRLVSGVIHTGEHVHVFTKI